ncbi:MAG: zinc transporter ZntB [bacterium]
MKQEDGLIYGCLLDGRGGGRDVEWSDIREWSEQNGILWIHLDRSHPESHRWLREQSGLAPFISNALLAEEIRPRTSCVDNGLLVILRGVNLNPDAEPEDMVSIRLWIESSRIISLQRLPVVAATHIRDRIIKGRGPEQSGDFLADLVADLTDRMDFVVEDLEDSMDSLENQLLDDQSDDLRSQLAFLRRKVITLHRHMWPQREVMTRLQVQPPPWLTELDRTHIREATDRLTRQIELLDAVRSRAAVTHEELTMLFSEQMNRTIYRLSIIAAIFLPLALLTALLGINVAGIPGADSPRAFWFVCLFLVGLACMQMWVFRRLKWF